VFGGALLSLGAYVFVSAALLGQNLKVSSVRASAVLANVRATMPKALLPMVDGGRLSDLQLGYGLWLVLILGVVGCARRRSAAGWTLTAVAGVLVCLLLPVPLLTESLWSAMPGAVIDVTNSAPMQRLYVILAAAVVTLLATVVAEGGFASRFGRGAVMVALGAAGIWSGMQARVYFQRAKLLQADSVTRSREYSEQVLRSENLVQARYALTFFGAASRYFSNGVMDPELENRLLRRDLRGYVATNVGAIAPRFDVGRHRDRPALPQLLEGQILPGEKRGVPLEPRLRVEPRQHYLLAFDFFNPPYEGVLQLTGDGLYREYLLPSSGLALSFGSDGSHSSVIPLYLDRPKAVDVRLEFTNANAATDISRYREFSHFELIPYDRSVLPIRLDGLVPYAATVHSPADAWLETMRQYQPGWTAEVNGQPVPVRRSPYGLVMLPVEAGESRVQVRFTAPWMLSWAYHFTWLAWVALLVATWWCRQRAGRDGAVAWAGSGTSNG
jgi:hypothetical protein